MPQTKNTTRNAGKSSAAKKTASSKSRASAGASSRTKTPAKTGSKASPKKTTAARPPLSESPVWNAAAPYVLAGLAMLIAVCVILGQGKIGGGIRNLLTGLFGGAAYAMPIFLLFRAFFRGRDQEEGQNTARTFSTVLAFLLLTMLLHILGGGAAEMNVRLHFENGRELIGGGTVGGLLGELLLRGFGRVCSLILLWTALVLLILFSAGVTPRSLLISLVYHIKCSGEKREERRAAAEEMRKNAPPTRREVQEAERLEYLRQMKQREREAKEEEAARLAAAQNPAVPDAPIVGNPDVFEPEQLRPIGDAEPESPAAPTGEPAFRKKIYRVKRRPVVVDIPVDDAVDDTADEAAPEERSDQTDNGSVPEKTTALDEAADQRLFEEVMRRTRERIEKNRRAEGLLDAEMSSVESKETEETEESAIPVTDDAPTDETEDETFEETETDETEDFADEEGFVTLPDEEEPEELPDEPDGDGFHPGEEEFDVSGIFANPEDAELLDKLAEAYRNPLEVHRESVSATLPVSEPQQKPVLAVKPEYRFPPIEILAEDPGVVDDGIKEELQENAVKLVDTLRSFNVKTKIVNISRGPTITRYELQPEPGTKVRSITSLVDDISLNMAAGGVRIEAPIPGKAAVGVEVPNKKQSTVHLRTLIEDNRFVEAKSRLTVCLGEDVAGEAVYFDIAKMPHLLIAGATGSGKSVCINSIITSILYKASPEDVKLILIDPKKVELNIYNGIPHLLVPVVSEPKKAAGSLSWAVGEMERRYGLIEEAGVRDIKAFNEVTKNDPDYEYMPRIVIIIDELADLMMTAPDDVEASICRIAQKARAAGMHLIIGTQRPSVDVITGLIKANVPSRIAFRTSSQIDSRTIIDVGSAANLIGMGDMLFNPVGALKPNRVQGAYVSESDVEEVVSYIKNMNAAYGSEDTDKIVNEIEREAQKCGSGKKGGSSAAADDGESGGDGEDPLLKQAVEVALESGKIATSLLQRRLSIGYGRAAKIIDRMEQLGYVSAPESNKSRKLLISRQDFMEMRLKDGAPFDE